MEAVTDILADSGLPARWFEDFFVGERFVLPTRRITADLIRAFADASGEAHPLYLDYDYCRARGYPGVLAHGFLVASQTVPGAGLFAFMVEASLVSMTEQSSRFPRPVYSGDTLHPLLQVTELAPNTSTGIVGLRSTVHNQRRELVFEGSQRWLLRKQPQN